MKLLVIDPHVTEKSPSMRAWVGAFEAFCGLFSEIEIWATECSLPMEEGVTWVPFPQRVPTWTFHAIDFKRRVNARLKKLDRSEDTLVQVTGCIIPEADIRYIHYWSSALLEEYAKRPETFPLPWIKRLPAALAAKAEQAAVKAARPSDSWWVVSGSLSENIAARGASGSFHTLPNQYDPARFNHQVRLSKRKQMRAHYGFQEDEKVMVFSAFGHFERKGLRQGIEAIEKLRRNGHAIRYLILGGTEETVKKFQASLSETQLECCVFAGLVSPIEDHLAAADALLFPSHFEAFSLAEIEAAALGLRLYLTPHYGSEMILREPVNGRLLPWDPEGMAQVIGEDISNGRLGTFHSEMGEALIKETYTEKLRELYVDIITRKKEGTI